MFEGDHQRGKFPSYTVGCVTIVYADCLDFILEYGDYYRFSALVSDPPYGLKFMGKRWDYSVPKEVFWRVFKRVLYPGSPVLSFGGTRTFHRLAIEMENAVLDFCDTIYWVYGQGFPKSINISKQIDKLQGNKRVVVGSKIGLPGYSLQQCDNPGGCAMSGNVDNSLRNPDKECAITKPGSIDSELWDGWGTALKPAIEPILRFQVPVERTYAHNALKYGVAGLNINGSRVGTCGGGGAVIGVGDLQSSMGWGTKTTIRDVNDIKGRWPANFILQHNDDCEIVGYETVKGKVINKFDDGMKPFGDGAGHKFTQEKFPDDSVPIWECVEGCPCKMLDEQKQGASRFFYQAKVSPKERKKYNNHPTVKPVGIMTHLCKLVSMPENNLILDPFAGSGSTLLACLELGLPAIGIEKDYHSFEIAARRLFEWQ